MFDPAEQAEKENEWTALDHRLTLHPAEQWSEIRKINANRLRAEARAFGRSVLSYVPRSKERDRALDDLEDCLMHSIAGIARHE